MLLIFKKFNPNWDQIKCIMSDKDMTERQTLHDEIPSARLQICLFHVLRAFKREVTCEKLKINVDEKLHSLEILQNIAYCKSSDAYNELYHELLEANSASVIKYYNDNWHGIKEQWVEGFKSQSANFLNRTNNRVESLNQKLKSVVSKLSNIIEFVKDLRKIVNTLRIERNHRAVYAIQKVKCSNFETKLNSYLQHLTPFAFGHVAQQFDLRSKVQYQGTILPETLAISIKCSEGNITVSSTSCECGFFSSMYLPCKHIFFLRSMKNEDIFSTHLCSSRWTKSYYKRSHVVFADFQNAETSASSSFEVSTTPRRRRVRVLSGQDKYRRVITVAQRLASVISEQSMREFNIHLQNMEKLYDFIAESKPYTIQNVGTDEYRDSTNFGDTEVNSHRLTLNIDETDTRESANAGLITDESVGNVQGRQDMGTVIAEMEDLNVQTGALIAVDEDDSRRPNIEL